MNLEQLMYNMHGDYRRYADIFIRFHTKKHPSNHKHS
jgi:hypothetical protein